MDPLEILKSKDDKFRDRFRSSSCGVRYEVGTLLRPLNKNGAVSYGKKTFKPFCQLLETSEDTLRNCIKVVEAFPDVAEFAALAKRLSWSHFVLLAKVDELKRPRILRMVEMGFPMTLLKARIAEESKGSTSVENALDSVFHATALLQLACFSWNSSTPTETDRNEMKSVMHDLADQLRALDRLL